MITDESKSSEFHKSRGGDHSHINGWGIDADAENDPTYPLKMRTDEEHLGYSWNRPAQQETDIEILRSVERPNITAVFGTSTPPSGLSGIIRRYAFKYSESSYGHWLPLLLADRVNVVEGILDDLTRGYVPNFFTECGWKAEWKYNRRQMTRKIAVVTLVTSVVLVAGLLKKSRSRS